MTFSRDISDLSESLETLISEANETVLRKGLPPGVSPEDGCRVVSWSVEGTVLFLEVVSGPHVRAHEGMLRLRKFLGQRLGREHRVGLRKLVLDEYVVEFSLPAEPGGPVSIPFAHAVEIEGRTCRLVLRDVEDGFIQRGSVDRMVKRLIHKVEAQGYEGKGEYWSLIEYHGPKNMVWDRDPTEEMAARGWLKQGPTKGKWFYRPPLAAVMRTMERIAVEEVLLPLGFREVMEPHHVPFDVWIRTGHMEGVPNEIYYISEPRTRDPAAWEEFIDHVAITREVPQDILGGLLSPPNAGSCYAQCPIIYWSFQGETVADTEFPILVFDRTANSNRYESGGRHGIERVDEFHRIEPVYIGTPEQLKELRERLVERYRHVFNDILDLEWRMAWVTPFYLQQAGQTGGDTEEGDEHLKGTMDFEAYLPYRGTREESEWLEFQNLSIVGDKYTRAFNIKSQSGLELWSGCSGIGLERWTAAFLAQKGLDPGKWPEPFLKRLGDLPETIKTL
ncbi:MAG: serine--tRNA ligase [Thermoplasmata archaeon]|nr:serine--tRNA ligase [Thermoplasmata archaeon]